MFSKLQVQDQNRDLVLILLDQGSSAVKFDQCNDCDVYVIYNFINFYQYVQYLLSKSWKSITIINIFGSFATLVPLLKFLMGLEGDHQKTVDDFHVNMNKYLNIDGIKRNLAPGQCDLPLPFKFYNVLPHSLLEPDLLAPTSIMTQQFLRFIGLKHGTNLVATSSFDAIVQSPLELLSNDIEVKPIMDTSRQFSLVIPSAWDSYNKIVLLAKSSIYDDDCLLKSENDCLELNMIYNSIFDGEKDTEIEVLVSRLDPSFQKENLPTTKHLLTLNEMLVQANQPEGDI